MLILKKITALALSAVLLVTAGCAGGSTANGGADSGKITVLTREEGSGTRSDFAKIFKVVDADGKDAIIDSAEVKSTTFVMLAAVADNKDAIGYVSLGSVSGDVKPIAVDGVLPTPETVKDGSYSVKRPFIIAVNGSVESQNPKTQDFIKYILSKDGQDVIVQAGFVAVDDNAPAYEATEIGTGVIKVAGSSSVTPAMEKLKDAYEKLHAGLTVEVQQSDSTNGLNSLADGVVEIGMSSRDLKDTETAGGLLPITIAIDGIAVIVNPENPVTGLSNAEIGAIYSGETTTWSK